MYTLFSDGGSRGNPGPAAYGFVIYDPAGEVLAEKSEYIGVTTNNQAEYQGIVAALEGVKDLNISGPLTCKLDSQLVVRQINGIYKMKNADLKPWLDKVRGLVAELPYKTTFVDVPREQNKHADRLVNVALDAGDAHVRF